MRGQEGERDDRIDDAIAGPERRGRRLGIGEHDVLAAPERLEAGGLGGARDAGRAVRIRAGAGGHREQAELEWHRDLLAPHSTRGLSYVVAAREIGVVLVALLGMLVLREPRSPTRRLAAVVIFSGLVVIAVSR